MQISELIDNVRTLEARLLDLGFVKPDTTLWVDFCGHLVHIELTAYTSDNHATREKIQSDAFKADTEDEIPAIFEALTKWIDEQVTPQERREADFQKTLAFLIEEGREIGTPILADLEATMKRLSENILTA